VSFSPHHSCFPFSLSVLSRAFLNRPPPHSSRLKRLSIFADAGFFFLKKPTYGFPPIHCFFFKLRPSSPQPHSSLHWDHRPCRFFKRLSGPKAAFSRIRLVGKSLSPLIHASLPLCMSLLDTKTGFFLFPALLPSCLDVLLTFCHHPRNFQAFLRLDTSRYDDS